MQFERPPCRRRPRRIRPPKACPWAGRPPVTIQDGPPVRHPPRANRLLPGAARFGTTIQLVASRASISTALARTARSAVPPLKRRDPADHERAVPAGSCRAAPRRQPGQDVGSRFSDGPNEVPAPSSGAVSSGFESSRARALVDLAFFILRRTPGGPRPRPRAEHIARSNSANDRLDPLPADAAGRRRTVDGSARSGARSGNRPPRLANAPHEPRQILDHRRNAQSADFRPFKKRYRPFPLEVAAAHATQFEPCARCHLQFIE